MVKELKVMNTKVKPKFSEIKVGSRRKKSRSKSKTKKSTSESKDKRDGNPIRRLKTPNTPVFVKSNSTDSEEK